MLDSATCAAILRRSDSTEIAVLERLTRVAVEDVCISAVTLSELMYGAEVSRRSAQERAALEVLLRHVAVLDYPSAVAEHFGAVWMVLELCEVESNALELMEAAHARFCGRTLVSARAREMSMAPGVEAESWAGVK